MPNILLSSIRILPNRQRQEFDPEAMQELVTSIETYGLLHAPVLRWHNQEMCLVAGERRLRAIEQIFALGGTFTYDGQTYGQDGPNFHVPFIDLGTLGELEAEEAELDENLRRRDLTWQEHAAAVARLHALRQAQWQSAIVAASRGNGRQATGQQLPQPQALQPHTVADTAQELLGRSDGSYQAQIRKEILVANHLGNPIIAKAKSADEAFKILRQQEMRDKNIAMAARLGATQTSDRHQLINGDCLDYMRLVAAAPEESKFDVICTDPPYGMGADRFGDAAGKLSGIEHHYDDSYEGWKELMTSWAPLSFAVAKLQAHAYVFCDFDNFHELKGLMQAAGWYVFRTPFIIRKINSGRVPLPDRGPRRQYELALYAIKGNKPVTHIYPDVLEAAADDQTSHGAQKPVSVFQNLLQRSICPGDMVLDPFCGSGPVLEAAQLLHCTAVAVELNSEYYAIAAQRLQKMKQLEQPSLF